MRRVRLLPVAFLLASCAAPQVFIAPYPAPLLPAAPAVLLQITTPVLTATAPPVLTATATPMPALTPFPMSMPTLVCLRPYLFYTERRLPLQRTGEAGFTRINQQFYRFTAVSRRG
ncbi:MAG: hypothetical protein ACUVSY_14020 [Roseiflexus sp.]